MERVAEVGAPRPNSYEFSYGGRALLSIALLAALAAAVSGCGKSQAQQGPAQLPPPEVSVAYPVTGEVTDYEDFPGRLTAVNSVDITARVTGYLEKVNFREGADVKKGDVLCEIDPRPYEAELHRAEGSVLQLEGRLKRLDADYERGKGLFAKGNMSREEFDRITADRTEAQGMLKVNEAARDLAELNLSFTRVVAPLSGKISSRAIDPGNLVKADDTVLTTIVSLDPIYVYFDLDERRLLKLKSLIREKKIEWPADGGIKVLMGLANEEGYPHEGWINFTDNRVEPDTGTWRLRGRFDNPDHFFTPGLFVRVRLPIGNPYTATLVAEEALGTDQGQKFLYVVNEAGKVENRRIKVGPIHNGLRVISEGLTTGEKVVVSGLQRVRQGIDVKAEVVPMPGTEAAGEAGG